MINLPQQKNKGVRCLEFDGNWVVIPNHQSLQIINNFTFSLWFKNNGELLSRCGLAGNAQYKDGGFILGFEIAENYSTRSIFTINSDDSEYGLHSRYGAIDLNEWAFLVGIFDETYMKMYINGIFQNERADVSLTPATQDFKIGYSSQGGWGGFYGLIDDVRIYNRALDAAEVSNLYKGRYVDPTGLVARWKMNEGNGSIAHDSVGSNDGTIYGAEWATSRRRINNI